MESNANVVCLQECTNTFLSLLTENKSVMDKYKHFGIQDFKTFYGVIILSEWPVANIYEYNFNDTGN